MIGGRDVGIVARFLRLAPKREDVRRRNRRRWPGVGIQPLSPILLFVVVAFDDLTVTMIERRSHDVCRTVILVFRYLTVILSQFSLTEIVNFVLSPTARRSESIDNDHQHRRRRWWWWWW